VRRGGGGREGPAWWVVGGHRMAGGWVWGVDVGWGSRGGWEGETVEKAAVALVGEVNEGGGGGRGCLERGGWVGGGVEPADEVRAEAGGWWGCRKCGVG